MLKDSAKINKGVKILVKKKNLLKNLIFHPRQSHPGDRDAGSGRKVQGLMDLYSDPKFRELMNDDNGWGNGMGSGGFGWGDPYKKIDIWGNDKEKDDWINAQEKRKKNDFVFNPGQIEDISEQNADQDQIIYIQPSISEEKLQELRQKGQPFYDEQFPPGDESLYGPYQSNDWDPVKWKNISKKFKDPKIFVDKPNPQDIKQGYLGDCYFLAGISALSEKPDRIYELFLLRNINQLNYYSVKMIYRGKWRTVDLDDTVPFLFNQPAFSKSGEEELWVIMLEKAWAKIYGSYKQIQAGFAEEPLHDLTGAPIKHLFLRENNSDPEQNWQYLYNGSLKEYAMVASSNPGSDTQQSATGVVQGHAYTFLNATQVETSQGTERIVKLRNPWGSGQFKGKWSDFHSSWDTVSEEEKKRVRYEPDKEDGTFFMNYNDFMREFRSMTIAEINDNASYVYESCIDPECKGVFFKVKVMKSGQYSFQIDKTPQRSYTGEAQMNFRYPSAEIQIGKLQENYTKKFRGLISKRRTLFKKLELTPGEYIVKAKIKYDPNYEEDYEVNLAVYSQFACGIELASRQEAILLTGDKKTHWNGGEGLLNKKSTHMGRKQSKKQNQKKEEKNDYNFFATFERPHRQRATQSKMPIQSSPQVKTKAVQNTSEQSIRPSIGGSFKLIGSGQTSLADKKPSKGKRIRQVQLHKTTVETTRERTTGEVVVTVQTIENKKETLSTHQEGKKIKEQEKIVQMSENQFMGEVINAKDNYKETITTIDEKPNGEVTKKVEVKEGQTETLEEQDSHNEENEHKLENIRKVQEKEEVKRINEQPLEYSDMDEEEKKQIMNQMQKKAYGDGSSKYKVKIENQSDNQQQEL